MITKISTKDMSREEWLAKRRQTIGGSDAGALMGLNPYSSPFALWSEKTGRIVTEDISDVEAVRLGNDLEAYVAERWMEKTGKKVRRDRHFIYNDKYPFAHANIDRAVVGENAGLECKTTSAWDVLKQCKDGKYPEAWYCQIVHYLMVTGADRWYLGVLVLGKGFFEFTIERNEAEVEALAKAEADFWNHVETDTAPAADGAEATTETISLLFPESSEESVNLFAYETDLASYMALGKQIKELEALRDEAANRVKAFMGTAGKGETDNYKVSWASTTRNTFDSKRYAKDNPGIDLTPYYNTSSYRTFKIAERK